MTNLSIVQKEEPSPGVPLWVTGMIMTYSSKKNTYYSCPNCKFAS